MPNAVSEVLRTYVYSGQGRDAHVAKLAAYVRSVHAALTSIDDVAAVNGELVFLEAALPEGGNIDRTYRT